MGNEIGRPQAPRSHRCGTTHRPRLPSCWGSASRLLRCRRASSRNSSCESSAVAGPPRSAAVPAAVADAGGWLVLAGLLEGVPHDVDEVLVLDATSLLVADYLVVRHEGAPDGARAEYALASRVVAGWFPVRAVAIDAALATGSDGEVDAFAAPALAESLSVPVATKNPELTSAKVPVLVC